jgi:hypothetical protein
VIGEEFGYRSSICASVKYIVECNENVDGSANADSNSLEFAHEV